MYTHSATSITSYQHTVKLQRLDSIKSPKNKLSLVDPRAKIVLLGNLKIVQSKASKSQTMCLQLPTAQKCLVSIHTCLTMYGWTPMITINPSLRHKSLRARNKVAHFELLRGLVPRYAVTVIYRNQQRKKQNRFSVLRKKRAKPKTRKK